MSSLSAVEALVSGHPRVAKMVPITGAGRLRECKNTKFVWELRKTGFCGGGVKYSCFSLTCTHCIQELTAKAGAFGAFSYFAFLILSTLSTLREDLRPDRSQ